VAAVVQDEHVDDAIVGVFDGSALGELLDIGTGTGRVLRLLAGQAEQATGIDISSEMLMVARTNLHAAGLHHCTVRHGNMYKLPFGNASFDTVAVDQVLSQAEHPALVLAEAARILRPGGALLVVDFGGGDTGEGIDGEAVRSWMAAAALGCSRVERVPRLGMPPVLLFLAHKFTGIGDVAA
jgi:ArsR family transcriptional regulator